MIAPQHEQKIVSCPAGDGIREVGADREKLEGWLKTLGGPADLMAALALHADVTSGLLHDFLEGEGELKSAQQGVRLYTRATDELARLARSAEARSFSTAAPPLAPGAPPPFAPPPRCSRRPRAARTCSRGSSRSTTRARSSRRRGARARRSRCAAARCAGR